MSRINCFSLSGRLSSLSLKITPELYSPLAMTALLSAICSSVNGICAR